MKTQLAGFLQCHQPPYPQRIQYSQSNKGGITSGDHNEDTMHTCPGMVLSQGHMNEQKMGIVTTFALMIVRLQT